MAIKLIAKKDVVRCQHPEDPEVWVELQPMLSSDIVEIRKKNKKKIVIPLSKKEAKFEGKPYVVVDDVENTELGIELFFESIVAWGGFEFDNINKPQTEYQQKIAMFNDKKIRKWIFEELEKINESWMEDQEEIEKNSKSTRSSG